MSLQLILLTAVALSMDAFAVSISCGMSMRLKFKESLKLPVSFGLFQALMPIIGFYSASLFAVYIMSYDHWIAFFLLMFIGVKMIFETLKEDPKEEADLQSLPFLKLMLFSVATSIDALATGIGFAFFEINIFFVASAIGIITFIMSFIGVRFGSYLGEKSQKIAGISGGVILILIGVNILYGHLTA